MRLRRLEYALFGSVCFGAIVCVAQQSSASTTFRCSRYGFSMQAPMGWNGSMGPHELPFFFNFTPSRGLGKGLLPDSGATINTVARDNLPRTPGDDSLAGWARARQHNAIGGPYRGKSLQLPSVTGIGRALRVSFDTKTYSPTDQKQHKTSVYWEFNGKYFATHLFYIVGDPSALVYEHLLIEVLESVRPVTTK